MKTCILCKKPFTEYGNNPEPLAPFEKGKCCNDCNLTKVIPARLQRHGIVVTPRTKTDVKVKLVGTDGNAFAVLGQVTGAMRRAGVAPDVIESYKKEATSGDYNNLLAVTSQYVEVL